MAGVDPYLGLLQGLNSAVGSYQDRSAQLEALGAKEREKQDELAAAKEKRKQDQAFDRQKLKQEAANHGRVIDFDEAGNVIDNGYDKTYLQMQKDKLNADPFGTKQLAAATARANLDEKAKGTPDERKALSYASRLQQAEDVFGDLTKQGYDRATLTESARGLLGSIAPAVKTTEYGKQTQAENNFINAQLRRESGAAIGKEERAAAEVQYFPRPGDTPEVVEQKRLNRIQAIKNLNNEAGRGLLPGSPDTNVQPAAAPKMVTVIAPNGREKMIPESMVQQALQNGGRLK